VRISGYPPRPGARASAAERGGRGGRKKEEGIDVVGGRRGSRLRLGADFGVPSTPEEPDASAAERRKRGRKKEEGS
jgi:hypothetical protein